MRQGLAMVSSTGGHPLPPLVVGKDGGNDDENGENAQENLHGVFRIA